MNYKLSFWEKGITWFAQVVAASIMLQTLYFKFSGAEESIYIFSTIGMEPWGRYATGVAELVASVLLVIPKHVWKGALMALGLMAGAIFFHLTVLGISIEMDHGILFDLAIITLLSSLVVLVIRRNQIPFIVPYI